MFTAGADALILDLEDGVPPEPRPRAPEWSPRRCHPPAPAALVRVNAAAARTSAPRTSTRSRQHAAAIRIPKSESADDVAVGRRAGAGLAAHPAIESARGVLAAQEIACVPGVAHLSIGGLDLLRDLYAGDGALPMLYVRSHLVVVLAGSRAAPPIDSVSR